MFTTDDLWRIFTYIQSVRENATDPTVSIVTNPLLSTLTRTLAQSEQQTVENYFTNILDQQTFSSDDYKRLRGFFVDWYASLRTLATTEKFTSDIFTLPSTYMNELFRSFGFDIGLNLVPLENKTNFFLDLVSFYKKKGTPETFVDVLNYYGFSDTDLIEYWLVQDDSGSLVFRPESVRTAALGSTLEQTDDIPFSLFTSNDPHWLLTESQILQLISNNKINLPSKSPYFALSSVFNMSKLNAMLHVLQRVVQDEYARWKLYGLDGLNRVYEIKNMGEVVSVLELYVSIMYVFVKMFGPGAPTYFERYKCYDESMTDYYTGSDPPIPTNLGELSLELEALLAEVQDTSSERDTNLVTYFDSWTRLYNESSGVFYYDRLPAEAVWEDEYIKSSGELLSNLQLEVLNSTLKQLYDSWFATNQEWYLLTNLLGTLDNWMRFNIDSRSPSLVVTMIGLIFRDEMKKLINFWKPYRARLVDAQTAFAIKNRLHESVVLEDLVIFRFVQEVYDDRLEIDEDLEMIITQYIWDRNIGCRYDWENYDSGGFYDRLTCGVDWVEIQIAETFHDTTDSTAALSRIEITDDCTIAAMTVFTDIGWRGTEPPQQYDVGYVHDTQYNKPSVSDYVEIVEIAVP